MCQRIKPSRMNQKNILPCEYTHASDIRGNIKKLFFIIPIGEEATVSITERVLEGSKRINKEYSVL